MTRLFVGLLAGAVFGALSVASMLPLAFADKQTALLGAFLNRFAIGAVIGAAVGSPQLAASGIPPWLAGVLIALLVSLPDAVITKAYAPILVLGVVGGAVIGYVVGKFPA
jgi:hypothetical protein